MEDEDDDFDSFCAGLGSVSNTKLNEAQRMLWDWANIAYKEKEKRPAPFAAFCDILKKEEKKEEEKKEEKKENGKRQPMLKKIHKSYTSMDVFNSGYVHFEIIDAPFDSPYRLCNDKHSTIDIRIDVEDDPLDSIIFKDKKTMTGKERMLLLRKSGPVCYRIEDRINFDDDNKNQPQQKQQQIKKKRSTIAYNVYSLQEAQYYLRKILTTLFCSRNVYPKIITSFLYSLFFVLRQQEQQQHTQHIMFSKNMVKRVRRCILSF